MSKLSPELLAFLATIPAGVPPEGTESNFIDPPWRGGVLIILHATFLPLMLMAIIIRMIVRFRIVGQLGWDDYTCCVAALASVSYSVCIFNSFRFGFGRHVWDIHATLVVDVNHVRQLTANIIAYPLVCIFVKLSILLLYRRLFWSNDFQRRGVIVGFVILVTCYGPYLGTQIYINYKCTSEAYVLHQSFCSKAQWPNIGGAIVNIITDFYILLLPLPCLLTLEIEFRRKVGLCCIFLAGLLACLISIARLIIIIKTLNLDDFTWNMAATSDLSVVEVNLAIICACTSTLPPFIARSKLLGSELFSSFRFSLRERSCRLSKAEAETPPRSSARTHNSKRFSNSAAHARGGQLPLSSPRASSTAEWIPLDDHELAVGKRLGRFEKSFEGGGRELGYLSRKMEFDDYDYDSGRRVNGRLGGVGWF